MGAVVADPGYDGAGDGPSTSPNSESEFGCRIAGLEPGSSVPLMATSRSVSSAWNTSDPGTEEPLVVASDATSSSLNGTGRRVC